MMREGGREGEEGREGRRGDDFSVFSESSSWNRSLAAKLQKGEGVAFKNSPESRVQSPEDSPAAMKLFLPGQMEQQYIHLGF